MIPRSHFGNSVRVIAGTNVSESTKRLSRVGIAPNRPLAYETGKLQNATSGSG